MKTIQLIGEAVIGQQTTLTVVDAILLASKVKKVRDVVLKTKNDDGSIKQFYGRLNDEEMIAIADICIFIDNITKELGVDFNEAKLSLFGEDVKDVV